MRRLAARAAAFPAWQQDLVLAVVLAALNAGIALPYAGQLHPLPLAMILLVLEVLPLTFRRYHPALAFFAVGLPRTLYDQLGFGYAPLPLGPAIAYFTVMERCSARWRWAISAILAAGIIQGQALPGHNEPYDLFVQLFTFAAAGLAGLASRARRAYLSEMEARAARAETERDRQAALAAARERTRIARELHDVVAHHVSLMAVQAEAASSLLPAQPAEAGRSVEIIGDTARQALVELRRLLGVLRGPGEQPGAAPSPSLAGLDTVLAQVRGAGLQVDLAVEGNPGELAPGVELTAYRIVQEALTNALRHSAASRAAVAICYEPGHVTVSVTDSGSPAGERPAPAARQRPVPAAAGQPAPAVAAGARPDRAAPVPGGFGLAGITERVASCGGTLTVGPTSSGGFAVTARLPRR
ncbi:MAG TPA: sensor histidine kinase [Streptosporangiaceae bacterium]|nr:sensor histidine kinase [Streptosporangiaceae bacterium]